MSCVCVNNYNCRRVHILKIGRTAGVPCMRRIVSVLYHYDNVPVPSVVAVASIASWRGSKKITKVKKAIAAVSQIDVLRL